MVETGGAGCHWGWAVLGWAGLASRRIPGLAAVSGSGATAAKVTWMIMPAARERRAVAQNAHPGTFESRSRRSDSPVDFKTIRADGLKFIFSDILCGRPRTLSRLRWVKLPNTEARSLALVSLRLAVRLGCRGRGHGLGPAMSRPWPARGRAGPPVPRLGLGAAGGSCMLPSRSSFNLKSF